MYTVHRLVSFGLNVPPDCFCGHCDELWSICSSTVPWLKVVWTGFIHYSFCPLLWHQLLPCVMFFSGSVVVGCCVFLVSSVIFCPYLSFLSGVEGMNIVFGPSLQVPWVLSLVSRVACPSIYLCFLNVFGLSSGAFFSNASGEPMAVSVRSLVTLFISVFISAVRVCLPRSPLLAVLWSSWLYFFFFFGLCGCVFPLFAPPRSPSLAVLRFSWALNRLCLSVRVPLLAAPLGRLC